jgi:predicted nicotinamide N-methyase
MPLATVSRNVDRHSISSLQYVTENKVVSIAGQKLNLTTLKNVEQSIDQVVDWLESQGFHLDEIENLAPYFGVIWPSAIALASYMGQSSLKERFRGRTCIELGCGLAVPSFVCAKLGLRCTVVDHHPSVPIFLEKNIEQNEPIDLTFINAEDIVSTNEMAGYDWVIASDVLYDKKLVTTFAQMITNLASPRGSCVIADPGRTHLQEFVSKMKSYGWRDELVSWTLPASTSPDGKSNDIYVLIFNRN